MSAHHTTLRHSFVATFTDVHCSPSSEIMTLFVPLQATATNKERSADQHTDFQGFPSGTCHVCQDIALCDVATFAVDVKATSKFVSGDQHMHVKGNPVIFADIAHVVPFEDVMMVPEVETAIKMPRASAQHTLVYAEEGTFTPIQSIPFDDIIARNVPHEETATNIPRCGDHAMLT